VSNLRRRRPQDGPLHDDREQSPIAAQTTPTRHDIDDGVSNLRIVLNIIVRRAITHRLSAAPTPIHKPLIILQSRRFSHVNATASTKTINNRRWSELFRPLGHFSLRASLGSYLNQGRLTAIT
jgi:hypothetical protein